MIYYSFGAFIYSRVNDIYVNCEKRLFCCLQTESFEEKVYIKLIFQKNAQNPVLIWSTLRDKSSQIRTEMIWNSCSTLKRMFLRIGVPYWSLSGKSYFILHIITRELAEINLNYQLTLQMTLDSYSFILLFFIFLSHKLLKYAVWFYKATLKASLPALSRNISANKSENNEISK